MSIYPVPLQEWFPHPRSARTYYQKDGLTHEHARLAVKFARCHACGKQPKWNRAWGHHSLPWGYGEVWCSEKCLDSKKVFKGKIRQKKLIGKFKKQILNWKKDSENNIPIEFLK